MQIGTLMLRLTCTLKNYNNYRMYSDFGVDYRHNDKTEDVLSLNNWDPTVSE